MCMSVLFACLHIVCVPVVCRSQRVQDGCESSCGSWKLNLDLYSRIKCLHLLRQSPAHGTLAADSVLM